MSQAWFESVNRSFTRVSESRKGHVVRRAGAMSLQTEVSIPHGKWDVIYGFDLSPPHEPHLFLHIRFGAEPEIPRDVKLWPDEEELFAPPPKARSRAVAPARPPDGFHLEFEGRPSPIDALLYRFLGPRLDGDPRRQGWFFLRTGIAAHLDRFVPTLIRHEVRDLLQPGPDRLRIVVTPYQFRMSLEPVFDEEHVLDHIFASGVALLDASRSMGTRTVVPTLKTLDLRNLLTTSSGWCGVCGESLGGAVVHCGQCGAPHHTECWHWIGRCSIFGCGGRTTAR